MKSIAISSALIALLTLTGCGDKEPKVEGTATQSVAAQEAVQTRPAEEVAPVQTETVSSAQTSVVDDGAVAAKETEGEAMMRIEKDLQTVYFDFDKFNIREDMKDRVSTDAKIVKNEASKYMIKLEGNCDEWGSDEYNFALGLRRSNTIKKALVAEGVDESRITMVSFGESNPVCNNKTRECWAKNRRVEFKLLP